MFVGHDFVGDAARLEEFLYNINATGCDSLGFIDTYKIAERTKNTMFGLALRDLVDEYDIAPSERNKDI